MMLYISVKFHESILNLFLSYGAYTIVKFQSGITPKLYRQELRFLCSALRLMMLYISLELQSRITPKLYGQVLLFLCSGCRRMMLYISMKFHENILKGFQIIERTQMHEGQTDRWTDNGEKNNVWLSCLSCR